MSAFISRRISIRWLPDKAYEDTNTIVLTGARTGIFLDTRFFKDFPGSVGKIDWAFAGYKTSTGPNSAKWTRFIDSKDDLEAEDTGTNTTLPNGTILEIGSMVNPTTGQMTPYEEVWQDVESLTGLFIKNVKGTTWRAHVGDVQLALGRNENGVFWAWQAQRANPNATWEIIYSTSRGVMSFAFLPDEDGGWKEGEVVQWDGEKYQVLERSSSS